jgi:hypothetical protein
MTTRDREGTRARRVGDRVCLRRRLRRPGHRRAIHRPRCLTAGSPGTRSMWFTQVNSGIFSVHKGVIARMRTLVATLSSVPTDAPTGWLLSRSVTALDQAPQQIPRRVRYRTSAQ